MSNDMLYRLRGVTKSFHDGSRERAVLGGVELDLAPGESISVFGRSGGGKSTLLHILGLLDAPTGGEIAYRGMDVSAISEARRKKIRNREIGFVFQHYHLLPDLDVRENVLLPARMGGGGAEALQRAEALLEAVGLTERARQRPATISGGERQRAAIARALVNNPALLLCDEPTGNLDRTTAEAVLDLLFDARGRAGCALVLVTHDPALASRTDRSLLLEDGKLGPEGGMILAKGSSYE